MSFRRPVAKLLIQRLSEPPRRLQILAGPRQVGKTTLVHQVLAERPSGSARFIATELAATEPWSAPDAHIAGRDRGPAAAMDGDALVVAWQDAERQALAWMEQLRQPGIAGQPFVLVIDEVQRIPQWSTTVKGLWDATRARGLDMHVVLLGSAPLLVQQGLNESLTGRYELIRVPHWSYPEMSEAFGFSPDQYIYFGGYPGAADYVGDDERWRAYVLDALVEPSIAKDVLQMERVDKPIMLRRLFELGCEYSAQVMALDKVSKTLGQGHTLTLAHHLTLLGHAGLLTGLQKYSAQTVRQRMSPPKFQVLNNALMSARSSYDFESARLDRSHWGRLVESLVGTHLLNTADRDTKIHYWRESSLEVDYVIEHRGRLAALEVKSQQGFTRPAGLDEFCRRHPEAKRWVVGSPDLPLDEFLQFPASHWVSA